MSPDAMYPWLPAEGTDVHPTLDQHGRSLLHHVLRKLSPQD